MINYKYYCRSKSGLEITGRTQDRKINTLHDRDIVINSIMHSICLTVGISESPWDPFNVELIVQAQPEPKPQYNPNTGKKITE